MDVREFAGYQQSVFPVATMVHLPLMTGQSQNAGKSTLGPTEEPLRFKMEGGQFEIEQKQKDLSKNPFQLCAAGDGGGALPVKS